MNKNIVIAISAIMIIISSVIFYIALHSMPNRIDAYNVRTEDLYDSQKRIEQSLSDLNRSINIEIENQKILAQKMTELSIKANVPAPIINTTNSTQASPIAPVQTQPPRPVTRAS